MNIFWDWNNQKIRASLYSNVVVETFELVLRDVYPVSLAYVTSQASSNQPWVAGELPSNRTILFAAKKPDDLGGEALIRSATWTGSGSGTTTRYDSTWEFNTAALVAAMDGLSSLTLKGEFVLIRPDNLNEYSTQFNIRVIPDVNREEDVAPVTIYPAVQQYISDSGYATIRFVNERGEIVGLYRNGCPYIYISETGLWYPLTGKIQDGVPTPALGAGEVA